MTTSQDCCKGEWQFIVETSYVVVSTQEALAE